ncbi:MAG: hypothetical protein JW803_05935 [Endomicrobiales bacterium]|nr:hypothetical protein [Endomicrobiales bacterium]
MVTVIVSIVFLFLSLWGLFFWWEDFAVVIRGLLPVLFVMGSLMGIIAGISGIRDSLARNAQKKAEAEEQK